MPPGPKKRKAAKKKLEISSTTTNNNNFQEGNGHSPKSHDSSDSGHDLSSPSSPAFHEHHQNPLSQQEEDLQVVKDFEATGSVSGEPHLEKTEVEGVGGDGEEEFDTKEVDYECRVIGIESVEKPNVGDSFGSSSVQEVEKKVESPKKEELTETVLAIEPIERVVSLTKEVICNDPVEVNLAEEIGDSSVNESQKDGEEAVLPPLNGTRVDTSTPANSDNQQKDAAPVPPTVQPTSWKGCCGLFDVLMGSNR